MEFEQSPTEKEWLSHRRESSLWAKSLLESLDFLIFDTETTGLGRDARIVQISIVSYSGFSLLDRTIDPEIDIEPGASAIHGITNAEVKGKEKFPDIYPFLKQHLLSKKVVIYNASFDTRILDQCCDAYGLPRIKIDADCAMAYYSQYVGEWSDYHCSYRWQKLPGGDHSAKGDCLAVLKIMREMAEDFLSK